MFTNSFSKSPLHTNSFNHSTSDKHCLLLTVLSNHFCIWTVLTIQLLHTNSFNKSPSTCKQVYACFLKCTKHKRVTSHTLESDAVCDFGRFCIFHLPFYARHTWRLFNATYHMWHMPVTFIATTAHESLGLSKEGLNIWQHWIYKYLELHYSQQNANFKILKYKKSASHWW